MAKSKSLLKYNEEIMNGKKTPRILACPNGTFMTKVTKKLGRAFPPPPSFGQNPKEQQFLSRETVPWGQANIRGVFLLFTISSIYFDIDLHLVIGHWS